jgi:UDP-N-acetylglucosamine 2-epimerase
MIIKLEEVLIKLDPQIIIVFGDCDTTLAGGIVANKLGIKLMHIESGLRSYNKNMPEEINRVVVDYMADIKCCPNKESVENLKKELIINNVFIIGQLQIDLLKNTLESNNNEKILENNNLIKGEYLLLTIHRHYNTNIRTIKEILLQCGMITNQIFFPIHPRTRNIINKNNLEIPNNIILHDPINFLDMITLEKYSKMIITDSGGIQSEAHYLRKPCLTVRTETEWINTLKNDQNRLVQPNEIYNNYISTQKWIYDKEIDNIYNIDCAKEIVKIIKKYILKLNNDS